jgi:hypothetical protein
MWAIASSNYKSLDFETTDKTQLEMGVSDLP